VEEIDRYSGRFREEKGFLVMEGAVDHGDSFDIKMLLNNQIAGILPLQIQYIDNQCIYRYLTGEKISLTRFLSHQKLHFKEAYRLWKDIFHSCSICAEYLLQTDQLLLCPEYIYWDSSMQSFSFCYFPEKAEALETQIKRLCEFLLTVVDHEEKLGREFVYGWYEQVIGMGFYLSELERYLKSYRDRENVIGGRLTEEPVKTKKSAEVQELVKTQVSAEAQEPVKSQKSLKSRESGKTQELERKEVCNYYLKNVSKYPEALPQLFLTEGALTVGRAPGCDVVLPGSQISWHHAKIEVEEDRVFVIDTNSSNGVFLNKKRLIKEHPVLCRAGDIIGFADITYLLCTG